MDRVRGRRFDNEPKLNLKKVFATIIALIVIVMVVISVINLLRKNNKKVDDMMVIQTKYFSVLVDGKYGVIDGTGKTIIEPSYDEMIIIPDNTKAVFICTYDIDYSSGDFKTKVLNEKNQEILKNFNNVLPIENSDENQIWYEDNILKFEKDEKFRIS